MAKVYDFKVGDIVVSRNSDTPMTVKGASGNYVTCQWFEKDELVEEAFLKTMLQPRNKWDR